MTPSSPLPLVRRPGRWRGVWLGAMVGVCLGSDAVLGLGARSAPLGEVVKAFCLSAFENELAQAGKSAPQGMAQFACACVADRIVSGSSVDDARTSCRQATARRYSI